MTDSHNILHCLAPDHVLQVDLQLLGRGKAQHSLGLLLALCALGLQAQVVMQTYAISTKCRCLTTARYRRTR